jgi:hypothetical protein
MYRHRNWIFPALIIHFTVSLILASLFIQTAGADEVLISDGSRIGGEVLRHDTSVLKIETSFAGTLEIKWKDIVEVNLTEPGTVLLRDGQTLEIEAFSHEGDQFILYPASSDAPLVVAASEVKTFEAEAWELGEGRKRTGRINLAIEDEKGNTEKREFELDGELHSRWGKNHLTLLGQLEYDTTRGVTSADNWTVFANFDRTFTGKWYYSIALLLRQDRFKDLKLRSAIGPALGYEWK